MENLDADATIRGFAAGQTAFGRYILKKVLGRGGMGVVWLARDEKLEREVALKFLPEVVALDPVSVAELKRETRRNLELTHPHIVRIYDFVQDTRAAAISMEYVDGPSLSTLKLEHPHGVFPLAEVEEYLNQLADGLTHAHERAKIVHRDLKPANLMRNQRGEIKITDFGIATSIADSVSRVSNAGSSFGTAVYMSPQQMMGEKPSVTDDIYSVGATLYELLTGKPPFHSGNVVLQVTNKIPLSIAARRAELGVTDAEPVPEAWERAVAACLAKEPAQRPASVRALMQLLRTGELPVAAAVPPVAAASAARNAPAVVQVSTPPATRQETESAGNTTARSGKSHWLVAAVAVLALAAGGYFFLGRKPEPVQTEPAPNPQVVQREQPKSEQVVARPETNPAPLVPPEPDPAEVERAALLKAIASFAATAAESVRSELNARVQRFAAARPAAETAELMREWSAANARWEQAHAPASLVVRSQPDDAEVTIGDVTRRTPTSFGDLPAGRVTLSVAKSGYETRRVEFQLEPGKQFAAPVIELVPLKYPVSLAATTPGVTYEFTAAGEKFSGRLPAVVQLPAGRHTIRYQRAGFGEKTEVVVVDDAGVNARVDLKGALLRLDTVPTGAAVTLDGRAAGTTPVTLEDVPPGRREIAFALAEHEPVKVQREVSLGAEASEKIPLKVEPRVAYLRALKGHWAAGLAGLRFEDASGRGTYRAGANFVKGRNIGIRLVEFDAERQAGRFDSDEPKILSTQIEVELRNGVPFLRWRRNDKAKWTEFAVHPVTAEYFNKL